MDAKFKHLLFFFSASILIAQMGMTQQTNERISSLSFVSPSNELSHVKVMHHNFSGYSNHWDRYAWTWYSYGGVFLTSQMEIKSELWKLEMDIGNQLLLDELWVQQGFVSKLAKSNPAILRSPSREELNRALEQHDVLLLANDRDPVMEAILSKLPENLQFRRNRAFYLQSGQRTLFVIASHTKQEAERLFTHINNAKEIIGRYSLYKGLAGVNTNYLLITTAARHNPYALINKALQIGCSWIMVSGYNDWMIPKTVNEALDRIHFPFVFLPGQYGSGGVMYGMQRYPEIQDNTIEQCLDWCEKNNGLYFRNLSGAGDNFSNRYSGYVVSNPQWCCF